MRKKITLFVVTLFLNVSLFSNALNAEEYRVSSAEQIDKIERSLKPGDTIILQNGTWHNQRIELNAKGAEGAPIVFRAETPGKVILNGDSRLLVKGAYVTVSGLLFKDGALNDKGHVVRLSGDHLRFTQSAIVDYNPESLKIRYFWVSLNGHHHRVDHNFFSGQNHSGVTTVVWLNEGETGHHRIDHNYYGQRPKGDGNGFETIRIGTGKFANLHTFVLVENNVFEETDGEIEIISNKSNYNTYRNNTFINSSGTLTLRQGSYNIVEGNYFLGQFRPNSGGVRVISTDQLIINNHFENLAGRAGGIISVTAGNGVFKADERVLYPRVERSIIVGNNCINNEDPCLHLNAGLGTRQRTLLAKNLLVANNVFYREEAAEPFVIGQKNDSVIWFNNAAAGSETGYYIKDGVDQVSLNLNQVYDQVRRPSVLPPALSCSQIVSLLTKAQWQNVDLLAQRCHRVSNSQSKPVKPLFRNDVGPEWMAVDAVPAVGSH